MNEGSVAEQLADHRFTRDLSDDDRRALVNLARIQTFAPGQLLIQEGQPARDFFLIAAGRVAIEVFVAGGGTRTLQTIEANSAIGWSWLVPPYRWEFDARAIVGTISVVFDADQLRDLFQRRCSLALHIVGQLLVVVADRLKGTRLQLLDLYAPPSAGRS